MEMKIIFMRQDLDGILLISHFSIPNSIHNVIILNKLLDVIMRCF
jgi:hypothetical protein